MIPHNEQLPAAATLARLRREYTLRGLSEADAPDEPWALFSKWMFEAIDSRMAEPNALIVATADANGHPGVRTVLLKNFDERGLVFFTNYHSRKGRELESNPRASALLFWKELERQIRVDGPVTKVTDEESDLYFQSRPFDSRIGALASPQSEPIKNREQIETAFTELHTKYEGATVPRPSHWGGYRIVAETMEFWQGRLNRLHDRFRYTRQGAIWHRDRLAP
ncbi:MAG: pyridoxamine 5'-phosphate oxidase [Kiritimatiellae bacterium]|nr:pyridoxamine 5'-phosphate oxidase [Kiritimatiellia bacterium]